MKKINLKGKVFTGNGDGQRFIKLPWVKKQIEEKLGFTPYLGTLNLQLFKASVKLKRLLYEKDSVEICPVDGFCPGICFRACLAEDLESAIVIPCVENYPEDVLEVIAPLNLREKLQLKDGDAVEVKIML